MNQQPSTERVEPTDPTGSTGSIDDGHDEATTPRNDPSPYTPVLDASARYFELGRMNRKELERTLELLRIYWREHHPDRPAAAPQMDAYLRG